jgi:type IV pilus assembly protein PilB
VAQYPRQDEAEFYARHAWTGAPPLEGIYRAEGCESCALTGYRDRVGAFELVVMSDAVKRLMMSGAPVDELRAAAQADGSRTLLQEALGLVRLGVTTFDEIMRNVYGG